MSRVLLYTNDRDKKRALAELCREQGLTLRSLTPADFSETVGALAGAGGLPTEAGETCLPQGTPRSFFAPQEVMIFCGIDQRQLDRFLDTAEKRGIGSVKLKAMLTPTNRSWSLQRLVTALQQERKSLRKIR